jgi:hypothetical protein
VSQRVEIPTEAEVARLREVWLIDAETFGNGYAAYRHAYSLTNPHYEAYMEAQFAYKEQWAP